LWIGRLKRKQVEPFQVRLPRPARRHGRRVALVAEPPHPCPRAGVQRHPPLDPVADGRERRRDLGVARRRRRMKRQLAPGAVAEHPVQHEGVNVQVCVQAAARALHHGDAAGASARHAARTGAARIDIEQHPRVHPQHRPAEPVIPRQPIAQPIRHRQHPLPHRHPRQHRVHQMGGPLRHPAAATAGTPSAPFTRERHQVLARAALAPKPRPAVLEHAARQELSELALDELRQARSVAGLCHRAQEGLQVLGDDLMEHGVLGVAGPVDRSLEGHGPQVGSGRRPGQC
jgi:hypothetical protein